MGEFTSCGRMVEVQLGEVIEDGNKCITGCFPLQVSELPCQLYPFVEADSDGPAACSFIAMRVTRIVKTFSLCLSLSLSLSRRGCSSNQHTISSVPVARPTVAVCERSRSEQSSHYVKAPSTCRGLLRIQSKVKSLPGRRRFRPLTVYAQGRESRWVSYLRPPRPPTNYTSSSGALLSGAELSGTILSCGKSVHFGAQLTIVARLHSYLKPRPLDA